MTAATASVTVRSLHRYPVKSMLGEALDEVVLGPGGVPGDRGYAVVDAEDGTVASAKHPRKWAGLLQLRAAYVEEPRDGEPLPAVAITFPGGDTRRSDDETIVSAVTHLGHSLNLLVTAEGVERVSQLVRLRELGCDHVQGMLIGPPQTAPETALATSASAQTICGSLPPSSSTEPFMRLAHSTPTLRPTSTDPVKKIFPAVDLTRASPTRPPPWMVRTSPSGKPAFSNRVRMRSS